MIESTNPTATVQETTQTPAAQPTQTPAVNADINAIVTQAETKAAEAAEKKMTGVFKSMLEQQGFDTETITKMTAEWKSKQSTPEQMIKQLHGELETERNKITAMEETAVIKDLAIPSKEVDYYTRRIKEHAAKNNLSFTDAAKAYMALDPLPSKVPAAATIGDAGKSVAPTSKPKYVPKELI